jgi:hypothetical protein
MSALINDGGAAFPQPGAIQGRSGMSLRDYYAGKAMVALAASCKDFDPIRDADVCYEIADALVKARGAA